MKKLFIKFLSVALVLTMLFGVVAVGGVFAPKAQAAEDYQVGDIIEFGSYPQSEVKDEATLSALNTLISSYSWENDWVSYGYYSGDGNYGSMVQGDWMKYADVTLDGNKYRAVKFTQYRPDETYDLSSASNSEQDNNGYELNTVYWFKYEPIEWRVLDPAKGLVMAETCIDSQAFSNTIYEYGTDPNGYTAYWNDAAHTHYASDYATSSMRKWLNDDFYNTAFNDTQKSQIAITTLDNTSSWDEEHDSVTTNDKVFLLSHYDVINPAYGFSSTAWDYDVARRAKSTDYAKAQGCYRFSDGSYDGNAYWFQRSPDYSYNAYCVYGDGDAYSYCFNVFYTFLGVRPALTFNLKSIIEIKIETNPTVTSYNVGDTVSLEGLKVMAVYSDTSEIDVTSFVTVSNFDAATAGNKTATVEFEGETATFNYTVEEATAPIVIPTIKINNNPGTKEIKYGEGIKFTATATDMPDGAQIKWYVNGAEKGTGKEFTFSDAKADATITVKIVDKDGNVMKDATDGEISESEKVTVKAGFFQKLISFFKNLFKANRIIEQAFISDK